MRGVVGACGRRLCDCLCRAFTRSLEFPEDVDTQKIEATVENGLPLLNLFPASRSSIAEDRD
jgi:hypothetical protein